MNCNPYTEFFGQSHGAVGGIQADFAENNLCGIIAQPANSFSSLIYVLVGIIAFIQLKRFKQTYLLLFSSIGVGSFVLHTTSSLAGQILDFGSIFAFVTFLLFLSVKNYFSIRNSVVISILIFVLGILSLIFFTKYRMGVLAFELLLLIAIETKFALIDSKFFLFWKYAWIIFFVSFGFWLLDEFRIWDFDQLEHFVNAHSLWHFGTAAALYTVAKYYDKTR
jgi:Ceramidase